jgi:hypothetical protein
MVIFLMERFFNLQAQTVRYPIRQNKVSWLIFRSYQATKTLTFESTKIVAAESEGARSHSRDRQSDEPWIYGAHRSTALDVRFLTFLVRMRDVGRYDYFTEALSRYVKIAPDTTVWQSLM